MFDLELMQQLGIALAAGLLIGVERGWSRREVAEGGRIAGLRTFGLIGLLGGLAALVADQQGPLIYGMALMALAAVFVVARVAGPNDRADRSVTTEIAAFITFLLGALAMQGHATVVAALAVVVMALLALKPTLHDWLRRIEPVELQAGTRLLLISVVLLPVLPDQDYGPWGALNPYRIWLVVVLIAGLSFVGYLAVKLIGASRGIMLAALFGGLVSSTAVTLNLAQRARQQPELTVLLAAGIVVACATMFARIVIVVSLTQPVLLPALGWPMGSMAIAAYAFSGWLWRRGQPLATAVPVTLRNPLELAAAIQFGVLLAVVMLLVKGLRVYWAGDLGVYLLAILTGISDVDAITVAIARLTPAELSLTVATLAIVLAAVTNTLVKTLITLSVGTVDLARRVFLALGVALTLGFVALVLTRQ